MYVSDEDYMKAQGMLQFLPDNGIMIPEDYKIPLNGRMIPLRELSLERPEVKPTAELGLGI